MKTAKRMLKKIQTKILNKDHRSYKLKFDIGNFLSLARAYEQLLSESGFSIEPNGNRYKLLTKLKHTPPSIAYFIVNALENTSGIDGDVCEFGVASGETSAFIANEIINSNKTLHLFDSFKGLSKPTEKDELLDDILSLGKIDLYTGKMSCPKKFVKARLKEISFPQERYVIHEGFIDDVLETSPSIPSKISFAYIDFDFYDPTMLAMNFFNSSSPRGSIMIVGDYNYFSSGVKIAVDEFIDKVNLKTKEYNCFIPNPRYGHFAVLTKEYSVHK